MGFTQGQQVVYRRKVNRSGPTTNEIKVGTIMSFSPDGEKALVSVSGPGGRIQRAEIKLDQLEPVSATFKRASVQFNPSFRGILGYKPV